MLDTMWKLTASIIVEEVEYPLFDVEFAVEYHFLWHRKLFQTFAFMAWTEVM